MRLRMFNIFTGNQNIEIIIQPKYFQRFPGQAFISARSHSHGQFAVIFFDQIDHRLDGFHFVHYFFIFGLFKMSDLFRVHLGAKLFIQLFYGVNCRNAGQCTK